MALSDCRVSNDRLLDLLRAIERGRTAYVSGRHLEAVAHWELAWRHEDGVMRQLLQGLMQAAAAYRKLELEQPEGMVKLLVLAIVRLEEIPNGLGALRLDEFVAGLRRSREEARGWAAGGPRPGPAASLDLI